MVSEPEVLERMVAVWVRDVAPHVRRDCCILGARVASGVLDYFGIGNRVLPCLVFIANDAAMPLIIEGVPTTEWPPDAWSIGSPLEHSHDGYAGHVIVRTTSGTLIDLSAAQFNRAGRIAVDGPRVWADADVIARGDALITHDGGAWWRFEPTTDRTYRATPDWRHTEVVGQVIRTINNENGKGQTK